jgi:DNA primase
LCPSTLHRGHAAFILHFCGQSPPLSRRLSEVLRFVALLSDGWTLADEKIKQVKEANDIVDVVGAYVALRPAGPTYKALCPFHDDHRPSFDVDPRRQRYRCWSCGKFGDVITFVQEHEHVGFREALEILARRAGITLEKSSDAPHSQRRSAMLDIVRWAAQQYHECLLNAPEAEEARQYLGDRGLKGETVRKYSLGYAPYAWDWLVHKAEAANLDLELLETVGLIAKQQQGSGYYDRFRDRVQFPIKDASGRTVGFGGRILPKSPLASRGPKYYNSTDTPLFIKSECLYGLDQAKHAAAKAGYLAVVEGYTDALMAHQCGVGQVVATMGTALNARHVANLRKFAPRVVLVFDADDGGDTGVDRALMIFASHDVDLAVATLPSGLDPCDLLVKEGPEPFKMVLESAVDALEFKLKRLLTAEGPLGIEGQRRAVDAVLSIIAQAPPLAGQAGQMKTQLMVTRIARRLTLKEENVWARLQELRGQRRSSEANPRARAEGTPEVRQGKAAPEERQLLEILLADETLVAIARNKISADEIKHPGLKRLLQGLYALLDEGESPSFDMLRLQLDNDPLGKKALEMQEIGEANPDRPGTLQTLLAHFVERRLKPQKEKLQNQLHAAPDHQAALELLRQLQNRTAFGGMRDEG